MDLYRKQEKSQQNYWYMDDSLHYIYFLSSLVILLGMHINGDKNVMILLLIFVHFILLLFKILFNSHFMNFFFGVPKNKNEQISSKYSPLRDTKIKQNSRKTEDTRRFSQRPYDADSINKSISFLSTPINHPKYQGIQNYLDQKKTLNDHRLASNKKNNYQFVSQQSRSFSNVTKSRYIKDIKSRDYSNRDFSQRKTRNYNKTSEQGFYFNQPLINQKSFASQNIDNLRSQYVGVYRSKYAPQGSFKLASMSDYNDAFSSKLISQFQPITYRHQAVGFSVELAQDQLNLYGISKLKAQKMINFLGQYYRSEFQKNKKQLEKNMAKIDVLSVEIFGSRISRNDFQYLRILKHIIMRYQKNKQIPAEYFSKPLRQVNKEYFGVKIAQLKEEVQKINQKFLNFETKKQMLQFYIWQTQRNILPNINIRLLAFQYYNAGFSYKDNSEKCYSIAFDLRRDFSYVCPEQVNHSYNLEQTMLLVILSARRKVINYGNSVLSKLESL